VPEPLVSSGKVVRDDDGQPLAIRRYSDNLLLALLKARRPEKFKETRDAVDGPGTHKTGLQASDSTPGAFVHQRLPHQGMTA